MIPTHNTVPYKTTPIVTYTIMLACLTAFAYQLTLSGTAAEDFLRTHAMVPARYTDGAWARAHGLSRTDPAPFFTSMFLHGGIFHIATNMWALWVFAPALEDRLGPARFALLYIAAGVAAGLAHVTFNLTSTVPALGASGAISGIIAAYVTRFPYAWLNVLQPIGFLPLFFYMPAVLFAAIWFAAQVMQATGSALIPGATGGVAWWAHVGGFIVGWLLLPRLAPPADPASERDAAMRSAMWPWLMWSKWLRWWWGGRR